MGDYIYLGEYYNAPILWRCVGIDNNGPLMLSDKILCLKAFDAKGEDDYYHNDGWGYIRKSYGSNCWEDSNIRQWLNADTSVVNYSHCEPSVDNVFGGYNAYDKEKGFMTVFTSDEKKCIKEVTQVVNVNERETNRNVDTNLYCDGGNEEIDCEKIINYDEDTDFKNYYYSNITDRIFLLNAQQIGMVYRNLGEYINAYPTSAAVANSDYKDDNISADKVLPYWLNVPGTNGASYEHVQTIPRGFNFGENNHGGAYTSYIGIRPAFYLDDNKYSGKIIVDTDGDGLKNASIISNGSLSCESQITALVGQEATISVEISGDSVEQKKAAYRSLTFSSQDTTIADEYCLSLSDYEPKDWTKVHKDFTIIGYSSGITDITFTCNDGSKITCKVFVLEEIPDEYTVMAGTIEEVDGLAGTITISGKQYECTDEFDSFTDAQTILNDAAYKTVVVKLKNGWIDELKSIESVATPYVHTSNSMSTLTYMNKKLSNTSGNIDVQVGWKIAEPYSTVDLTGLDVPSVRLSKIDYNTSSPLMFSTGLSNIFTDTTSVTEDIDDEVKVGEVKTYNHELYIDKSYKPQVINTDLTYKISVNTNGDKLEATGFVSVGNLDLQQSNNEDSDSDDSSVLSDALADNAIQFSGVSGIAYASYFDTDVQKQIDACVKEWLIESMAEITLLNDEEGPVIELLKDLGYSNEDMIEKIFEDLTGEKLNLKDYPNCSNKTLKMIVQAPNKSGEIVDITFTAKYQGYSFHGDEKNFGSFTGISGTFPYYSTTAKVTGMITSYNMDVFYQKMKSVTKAQLKSIWGVGKKWISSLFPSKSKDKVAAQIASGMKKVRKKITKEVKKRIDNKYRIDKQIEENSYFYKIFKNCCPNDVYIYDQDGNLCASIVNNKIENNADDLFMYVKGDEKYVYLLGKDYVVKYVGTDVGSMDLVIESYCGDELLRKVAYEDVPLEKDKTYYNEIDEEIYSNNILTNLISEEGEITPLFDTWQDNRIIVDSDYEQGSEEQQDIEKEGQSSEKQKDAEEDGDNNLTGENTTSIVPEKEMKDDTTSVVSQESASVKQDGNPTDSNTSTDTTSANDNLDKSNSITEQVTVPAKVKISSIKNNKTKVFTVKWKKVKNAKGYQIQYALNKKFTKGKKTKTTLKYTFMVKKLKKGKVYYVRVRAYNTDSKRTKVYGKWSSIKKIKIKK